MLPSLAEKYMDRKPRLGIDYLSVCRGCNRLAGWVGAPRLFLRPLLPAHHERLAVTLWYFDADEHARAHAKGVAADQIEAREAEALERAIQGIHERYGTHV